MRLEISPDKTGFMRNGRPFFLLSDTAWCALYNLTESEWRQYLAIRKRQGFNAVQLIMLPEQMVELGKEYPFQLLDAATLDFYSLNDSFFEKAERFVRIGAEEFDMVMMLWLTWSQFIPDTEYANYAKTLVMPLDAIEPYVERTVRALAPYVSVFPVCGDTDFNSPAASEAVMRVHRTVKRLAPETLTTLHLYGEHGLNEYSTPIAREADFYMYQSGHRLEGQHSAYTLAQYFAQLPERKPIMNGEPCYEGMGMIGRYGRFHRFDVRKAFWQSVLAGASAGIAYGAYGMYTFHRGEGPDRLIHPFNSPFAWKEAIQFPGASDYSFGQRLFQAYQMQQLVPKQELLEEENEEIRIAASGSNDLIVIYVPYSHRLLLKVDFSGYEIEMIELETHRSIEPQWRWDNGVTNVKMNAVNSDVLIIAKRGACHR